MAEAARILRVSDSTVRRLLKSGQLEAQQVQRPQGHVWLVRVPAPAEQPSEKPSRQIGAAGASQPSPIADLPAPAEAIAAMIQATLTPIIAPLVGELAASRQLAERRADAIAELREERGRLTAELERAASTVVMLGEELDALKAAQASPAASTPRWRALRLLWPLWAFWTALAAAIALALLLALRW